MTTEKYHIYSIRNAPMFQLLYVKVLLRSTIIASLEIECTTWTIQKLARALQMKLFIIIYLIIITCCKRKRLKEDESKSYDNICK